LNGRVSALNGEAMECCVMALLLQDAVDKAVERGKPASGQGGPRCAAGGAPRAAVLSRTPCFHERRAFTNAAPAQETG
jgi:hypothetical protein